MTTTARAPWALETIDLKGDRVALRTSRPEDHRPIAEAINDPTGWDARKWGRDRPERIVEMLRERERKRERGEAHPLLYSVDGDIAGVTNLLRPDAVHRTLDIGGTWVAPRWRKTFVNTEVKFLLLRHCFETLNAERIGFRVDALNAESQRAVLRLGATLEGRLRHQNLGPDGKPRDLLLFSVVRPEWEAVKERLRSRLSNRPLPEKMAGDLSTGRI